VARICRGISQFYLHTRALIHEVNEPYLPLSSQPKPVLIYRPRRNGRLSWPG